MEFGIGILVEGYTNFSYAVLAIIPEFFNWNVLVFFKIIGLILISLTLLRLKQHSKSVNYFYFSAAAVILNPYIYIHAFSGLETPLFIFLLCELLLLLKSKNKVNEKWLFVVLLLLPLTRPEGALYAIVGFVIYIYTNRKLEDKTYFSVVTLIAIIYFVVRWRYFGYMLPNTFYAKSAIAFDIYRVIQYFIDNIKYITVLPLLFFIKDKSYQILLVVSLLVNLLYATSNLQMNFFDRFAFQTLIPFYIVAIQFAIDEINLNKIIAIAFLLIGTIWGSYSYINVMQYYANLRNAHGRLGVALSEFKNKNLTLLAGDVGILPYYAEWKTIDFIGLTDSFVAHNGFTEGYLVAVNPDLIVLYSTSPNAKVAGFDYVTQQKIITKYIDESHKYTFSGAIKLNEGFYLLTYLKNDIPDYYEIIKSINIAQSKSMSFQFRIRNYLNLEYLKMPSVN
jgi:arabinofuranosyltransferase